MPRGKISRKSTQHELHEGDGDSQTSHASCAMDDNEVQSDVEQADSASLGLILKELKEFRKDNSQQLKAIRDEITKTNKRIEEAEERIDAAETRIQTTEEAVNELLKLQIHLDAKLTDLEGRTRRENIRIHGVKEGAEENSPSVVSFVERLLREHLELPASLELRVDRAHRALMPKPPSDASPRSIVAKMSSYRMKEEILRLAWQKRGFQYLERRVNLDHDYAPDILKQRREYAEAKLVLKEKKIRFQTPFPAKLRVYYQEGTVLYGSAEEATGDMAQRGLPVSVIRHPESLLEQVRRLSWRTSRRAGKRGTTGRIQDYKDRLQAFKR